MRDRVRSWRTLVSFCLVDYREQRLKEFEPAAQKLLNLAFLWWGRCTRSPRRREQQSLETTILVSNQTARETDTALPLWIIDDPEMSPTTAPHHPSLMEKTLDKKFEDLKFIPENVLIIQPIYFLRIYYVRLTLDTRNITMNILLTCCQTLNKSPHLLSGLVFSYGTWKINSMLQDCIEYQMCFEKSTVGTLARLPSSSSDWLKVGLTLGPVFLWIYLNLSQQIT